MFKNLTDFSYKRTWLEVIVFYVFYFLVFMVLSGIVAALAGIFLAETSYIGEIGALVSAIGSPTLCLLVLKAKRKSHILLFKIIAGFSAILGYYLGALAGFIPAAIFTSLTAANKPGYVSHEQSAEN